jgi:hypothetical protein
LYCGEDWAGLGPGWLWCEPFDKVSSATVMIISGGVPKRRSYESPWGQELPIPTDSHEKCLSESESEENKEYLLNT